MRHSLLGGVVLASAFAFMVPSTPASAQMGSTEGQFRYHHGDFRHGDSGRDFRRDRDDRGFGWGASAALATGAIIGGAIASQGDYGYGYGAYPDYGPDAGVYADEGPGYVEQVAPQVADEGDATAYCERTFRSYDPASGTYLGYDGVRHPCP